MILRNLNEQKYRFRSSRIQGVDNYYAYVNYSFILNKFLKTDMPNFRQIGLILISAITLLREASGQQSAGLLTEANRNFELMKYPAAVQGYEQILKKKDVNLSDADKLAALLKLGFSYKQVRDGANAERVYREALQANPTLSGEDNKAYLYYAQSLANNGKYEESQKFYERYKQSSGTADVSKFYGKINQTLPDASNSTSKYIVEYLNINSNRPEFSPMYYKSGIVYCSGKGAASKLLSEKKGPFLDLYYINDLSSLNAVSEDGHVLKTTKTPGEKFLGHDYYSRSTANDSKTLNYFADNLPKPQSKAKVIEPTPESEQFSKSLNTKYHEGPATFSKDFSKIIFTRNNFNEGAQGKSEDNVTKLKLYTAESNNGVWGEAVELPFNSNEYSAGHPALTKDGKLLYFVSDMPGGSGATDLYVSENKNGKWTAPKNLGNLVNTKGSEMFPFVDENGNLYFSSDGLPGKGYLDIFFIEIKNGLPVGKAMNLGEPFNSPNDDFGIITDGERKEGYFSSDRKKGDDDDIYRFRRESILYNCRELTLIVFDSESKKALDNAEVELVRKNGISEKKFTNKDGNIKFCMNESAEYTFKIQKSGHLINTVGYSTIGESDNNPSRIEVPLSKIPEISSIPATLPSLSTTPEKVEVSPILPGSSVKKPVNGGSILKGIVKTEVEKRPIEGVMVILRNACDNTSQSAVTGPDGVYSFEMEDGCDYILEVAKDGYGKNVNKIKKIKKGKVKEISQDLSLFKEGDVVTIDNIYYDSGKSSIRKDAARELDKLAATLLKYPEMVIEIGSHTDSRGESAENQALSEKRAEAAVEYISHKGVDRNRMLAKGYGESDLVNECGDGVSCTEAEHQKNRRTTVKIIKVK